MVYAVIPRLSGYGNPAYHDGSVEVFSASGMTKDEFRSSPVPFLGFLALAATCVGFPSVRRTRFQIFRSLTVRAPAEWGVLLMKCLLEVAF